MIEIEEARFRFEAGLFIRRQVLGVLKLMAWDEGVEYIITNDSGWLSRVYFVKAYGPRGKVLMDRFMTWMKQVTGKEGGDP